jgi:diguanylate cyclase (GGDEF)-like protein
LTASELARERRKSLRRYWPAVVVPALHGAVFLLPILLDNLLPNRMGVLTLATGWVALIALEMVLYAVGTAFIVLVLTKERSVRIHKDAANTDPLTGLFNRRGFTEGVAMLIARRVAKNEPVTLLAFDLDHFKSINDRFGHAIGDEALKVFASTASANMRAGDIIGRLGGEEFVAVLPVGLADGMSAADRVRQAFQAAAVTVAGHPLAATVSIGVASEGARRATLDGLLEAADAALYRAKANGRNRVEATDPAAPAAVPESVEPERQAA